MANPETCDACKLVDQRDAPCDEDTPSDRDHHGVLTYAMRATEEAMVNVRCAVAPLQSHAELMAAGRALTAVAEARKAVHELVLEVMRKRGHQV